VYADRNAPDSLPIRDAVEADWAAGAIYIPLR
jgi:hypothetical protein